MPVPSPLTGRYAFTKRIRGTQRTIIWIARDELSGAPVVASVLPSTRAQALRPAVDLAHPHLASVLGVLDIVDAEQVPGEEPMADDTLVAVAEYVEGRSLQQRIDAGPVTAETAVEWMAAAADALATMHAHGAVHGAISPRALLVIRPGPAVVPVLTHLLVPPSGAYCSPERVTGSGPSPEDDTWALAATLYAALTRNAPFKGGSRTELARAIVRATPASIDDEPEISDILSRALAPKALRTIETAAALRDELRGFLEETGRKSFGDFAPVAAQVGFSEPPPNVGDLSLIAALAQPDTIEARAPLASEPPETGSDPWDMEGAPSLSTTELAASLVPPAPDAGPPARRASSRPPLDEAPPGAAPAPAAPPETRIQPVVSSGAPSAGTPVSAQARAGAPRRSRAGIAFALVALAALSAGAGLLVERLNETASEAARTPAAPPAPEPGIPTTQVVEAVPTVAPSEAPAAAPEAPPASATAVEAPSASAAAAEAPSAPAAAAEAPSTAACLQRVLPAGTLSPNQPVDFLCSTTDMWAMARKMNQAVAHGGSGQGLVRWAHLGRFDLAAVAVLWQRCCPGAASFDVATPKGLCESLPESTHALSRNPVPDQVDRYAADVECLVSHGVRYPAEWWDRVSVKDARATFDEFLSTLGR